MSAGIIDFCHSNEDDEDIDLHSLFINTATEERSFLIPCQCEEEINKEVAAMSPAKHDYLMVNLHCSTAASTDYDLTGQIVWPVSVLLSHYLASKRGQSNITGKKLVELGAGVGLPGLVASNFASRVLLTDGNNLVVESILKKNVSAYGSSEKTVTAQKFLWGDKNDLQSILDNFGTVDVVLAADVVQWPCVLEPLLNSIKALLWESSEPLFILGFVNRSQSIYEEFLDLAKKLGFTWQLIDTNLFLPGIVPDSCKERGGRVAEIMELRLTDRTNRPIFLSNEEDDSGCTITTSLGMEYQYSSHPC